MPLPVMSPPGIDLYERLSPLASLDEANDFAFAVVCGAVGAMWAQVAYLSEDRDDRPGWAVMVDVETAPGDALPWLATHAGVKLTKGATEDVQRDEVRRRAGVARGRPASTIAKVQAVLSGTKSVRILERSGSAWRYAIVVRTSEVPETDIPRSNLLPNPGPEINITGWSGAASIFNNAGAAVTRQTVPTPQIGPGLVRIDTDGVSSLEGATAALLGTFEADQPYTFAMYLRGDSGGETVRLFLGSVSDQANSGVLTLTTGWLRYSVTWTPATDQTSVALAIQLNVTPAAFIYANAGIVAPGATPADYGNGDSPGWQWDGTPHNSASHREATTIVYDAALSDKPGADIMRVVISDDPLVDDIALHIDDLTETIDHFTLGGVT